MSVFGSVVIGVAMATLGMKVVEKLVMDKIFPSLFDAKDKKEIHDGIKDIASIKEDLEEIEKKILDIPLTHPTLTDEEHKALVDLLDMHNVKDQDGIPMWFFPRSWHGVQSEILNAQKELAFAQRELVNALEYVSKVVEKLAERGR